MQIHSAIRDIVTCSADAGARLRARLGLQTGEPIKICYVTGPGDVFGTYEHWKAGAFDPRVPSVAYSTMFYEACAKLGAEALLINRRDASAGLKRDGNFSFISMEGPRGRAVSYHVSAMRYALALRRAVSSYAPHVTVVASDAPPLSWPLITSKSKINILSLHNTFWPMGDFPPGPSYAAKRWLLSFVSAGFDGAVATSNECARQFNRVSARKSPCVVEVPQQKERLTRNIHATVGDRRIVFAGRIETEKGVFDLLTAFESLAASFPEARLEFAGAGSALERLKVEVSKSSFRDRIQVLGLLDSEALHQRLSGAYAFVCPTRRSFHEGLAVVCLEAAAHGVPTILSSVVPASDLLQDSCVRVPADDVGALTDRLRDLLCDPADRDRRAMAALNWSEALYDRSLSWGSRLIEAMLTAADRAA